MFYFSIINYIDVSKIISDSTRECARLEFIRFDSARQVIINYEENRKYIPPRYEILLAWFVFCFSIINDTDASDNFG